MLYQTSIFAFKQLAFAVLAAAATGDAMSSVDPRPRVTLRVAIAGAEYEGYLKQERDLVAAALTDSLRALLDRRFGFLNLTRGAGSPRDTVEVIWRQLPHTPRNGYLNLRIRGASKISDTLAIFYEPIGKVLDRAPDDWASAALTQRWSRDADSIFGAQQELLVKSLFSNLPLSAKVRLNSGNRRAYVSLTPTLMRAASAADEEFRVRLQVRDADSEGPGWLNLAGCTEGTREAVLVCEMREFAYRGRIAPAETRQAELRVLQLKPVSLHVTRHVPASAIAAEGGVVGVQ